MPWQAVCRLLRFWQRLQTNALVLLHASARFCTLRNAVICTCAARANRSRRFAHQPPLSPPPSCLALRHRLCCADARVMHRPASVHRHDHTASAPLDWSMDAAEAWSHARGFLSPNSGANLRKHWLGAKVRYGVTVNIRRFHRRARGSIPRIGALNEFFFSSQRLSCVHRERGLVKAEPVARLSSCFLLRRPALEAQCSKARPSDDELSLRQISV